MYRFLYFLSVVPTIYIADDFGRTIIQTNQYAITEQSHPSAGKMGQEVPGISPPNSTNEQEYFSNMMLNHYS
jgi:hypothetical protein